MLAHDAGGESDIFQSGLLFPRLHLWIGAKRGINRLGQREKLDTTVHAFGIFAEHHLIDRDVRAAWISDLGAAIIQRVAGITFARPHVRMQVEHLTQLDDRRKVNQPLGLELRNQFFLGFSLRLARDGAEKTAGSFFQGFHGAIGKRIAFRAPKLPPDVARHIVGVEFQAIQHDARRFRDIVADSVTRQPRDFVFCHLSMFLNRDSCAIS